MGRYRKQVWVKIYGTPWWPGKLCEGVECPPDKDGYVAHYQSGDGAYIKKDDANEVTDILPGQLSNEAIEKWGEGGSDALKAALREAAADAEDGLTMPLLERMWAKVLANQLVALSRDRELEDGDDDEEELSPILYRDPYDTVGIHPDDDPNVGQDTGFVVRVIPADASPADVEAAAKEERERAALAEKLAALRWTLCVDCIAVARPEFRREAEVLRDEGVQVQPAFTFENIKEQARSLVLRQHLIAKPDSAEIVRSITLRAAKEGDQPWEFFTEDLLSETAAAGEVISLMVVFTPVETAAMKRDRQQLEYYRAERVSKTQSAALFRDLMEDSLNSALAERWTYMVHLVTALKARCVCCGVVLEPLKSRRHNYAFADRIIGHLAEHAEAIARGPLENREALTAAGSRLPVLAEVPCLSLLATDDEILAASESYGVSKPQAQQAIAEAFDVVHPILDEYPSPPVLGETGKRNVVLTYEKPRSRRRRNAMLT
ncbi:hypothetical protein DIPPA_35515 [Diplonema papillatum]|nr:hypothetical protein DIPPA_35515 [Diplonema papillatum]